MSARPSSDCARAHRCDCARHVALERVDACVLWRCSEQRLADDDHGHELVVGLPEPGAEKPLLGEEVRPEVVRTVLPQLCKRRATVAAVVLVHQDQRLLLPHGASALAHAARRGEV
eukprot:6207804-Pleurochrysis_carterae.AAC.4